ncbi:MAG: hypothetical protein AAFS11_08180, partial [Planctomycetota bacterium]
AADGALGLADAPGLEDVFPETGTGVAPFELDTVLINPTGIDPDTGLGGALGGLDSGDTDDFWRFTTTNAGFVSVLASTAGDDVLDTRVEVYLPNGVELTGDNDGLDNGSLARGVDNDGWFGFVALANQEYYVRVVGENAASIDPSTPGTYSLQINTANTALAVDADGVARTGSDRNTDDLTTPSQDAGDAEFIGSLQADNLYTFTTGSSASLGYALAGDITFGDDPLGYIDIFDNGGNGDTDGANDPRIFDRDLFDARIQVFDANGELLSSDSDSGFLYDAYALVRFEANSTYYVRVSSDAPDNIAITDPQAAALGGEGDSPTGAGDPTNTLDDVAIGTYELRIQTQATELEFTDADGSSQTRVIEFDRTSSGTNVDTNIAPDPFDVTDVDPAGLLRDQHSAQIFTYETVTPGTNFVNFFVYSDPFFDPSAFPGTPSPLISPLVDATISIFDDSGSLVAFQSNDTLQGGDGFDRPGLRFDAGGGQRFFIMVDFFDGLFSGTGGLPTDATAGQLDYRLVIESAATLDTTDDDQRLDDHIDFTGPDVDEDGVLDSIDARVAQFATPLVWGDPITPRGFIDDDFLNPADLNDNMVPDGYLIPGLLDPRLYGPEGDAFEIDDHPLVVQAFGDGRLDSGVDTDVFMFVPQVDMLGSHAGAIDRLSGDDADAPGEAPGQEWFPEGRPASRLTVNVFLETEWVGLSGTSIQIYDSNFNLVNEEFATPITSVIDGVPPGSTVQVPSGVQSPSLLPPSPDTGENVDAISPNAVVTLDNQYWGGEVYYLVVSAPQGQTRYNVVIQADAFVDDQSQYAFDLETAEEGNFGAAQELVFDNFSGVATNNNNLNNTGDIRIIPTLVADVFDEEETIDDGMGNQIPNPNFGQPDPDGAGYYDNAIYQGQLGLIHNVNDTDIYRFTAQNDGTTEILLSTTNLQDSFFESLNAGPFPVFQNTLNKTYNSPLDAAIRVYDSTGTQIAYVDDFLGYDADGETLSFLQGAVGDIEVQRKDPRFVIEVERGEQYFVVVESSQRYAANAADPVFA